MNLKNHQIDHYEFGRLHVGGNAFVSDLIIYPDGRIQDNWRRQTGHDLVPDDIAEVLAAGPGQLIVGTGANGRMRVAESVTEQCRQLCIILEILPTARAVDRYNLAKESGIAVAACFHLTC